MILDINQLEPTVACLLQNDKVGTGFFIEKENVPYLVTAEHVERNLEDTAQIIVSNIADSTPITLGWSELMGAGARPTWERHPTVDISVLKLSPDASALQKLAERFLPFDLIPDALTAPERETNLTSLGFPLGLGVQGHVSPLAFETRPASRLITLPRFDNKMPSDFYILQDPSVGGYSGCPVFDTSIFKAGSMVTTGSGTVLWGITHGTISDKSGGKMGAVTPSFFVRDLI
jgi:hypothetical protein